LVEITTLPTRLVADPARVVIRPLHIAPGDNKQPNRTRRIVEAVLALSDAECDEENALVDRDFDGRHWQTQGIYLERFRHVAAELGLDPAKISAAKQELIGASFCHEYSYAAAAIMNPSIVPHPDQTGLAPGDVRFVLSLRAVGEGHISSIAFREGIVYANGAMSLLVEPPFAMAVNGIGNQPIDESDVRVSRDGNATLSGSVIFPFTRQQRNGLEDLRLVRFAEPGEPATYYGTYTAFSGAAIASELLSTDDFRGFRLRVMRGRASASKGLALFPRRIGGRYAVIGRQDHENLYFLQSDNLLSWDEGVRIMGPRFAWERIQIGNCGAPIELDEGWLLLTHGVGAMRQYSIGAALLDKKDPRKVLERTSAPLLCPSDESREGYVPNVVYTCGALATNGFLFMPYGVADSSVAFCTIPLKSLLESMV
jgi:predicted GH43/DUF377 family glycosyl hydrolase